MIRKRLFVTSKKSDQSRTDFTRKSSDLKQEPVISTLDVALLLFSHSGQGLLDDYNNFGSSKDFKTVSLFTFELIFLTINAKAHERVNFPIAPGRSASNEF